MKFYFTFGSNAGFPYQNSYLTIEAETEKQACDFFKKRFPWRKADVLNCAFVYTEESFKKTCMHLKPNPEFVLQEEINLNEDKPEIKKNCVVSRESTKLLDDITGKSPEYIYQKYGFKRDESISFTVNFKNGIEADVKMVLCDDDTPWTEAVLFDHGSEIFSTEISEDIFGSWEMETASERYIVDMIPTR